MNNSTTIGILVAGLFYLLSRNTTGTSGSQPVAPGATAAGAAASTGSSLLNSLFGGGLAVSPGTSGSLANTTVAPVGGGTQNAVIAAGLTSALSTTNDASYGLTTTQTIDTSLLPTSSASLDPSTSVVYDPTQDASLDGDISADSDVGF